MRGGLRVALLVVAIGLIVFGAWFALRFPPSAGWTGYSPLSDQLRYPLLDQAPIRIGVAMASAALAGALATIALVVKRPPESSN